MPGQPEPLRRYNPPDCRREVRRNRSCGRPQPGTSRRMGHCCTGTAGIGSANLRAACVVVSALQQTTSLPVELPSGKNVAFRHQFPRAKLIRCWPYHACLKSKGDDFASSPMRLATSQVTLLESGRQHQTLGRRGPYSGPCSDDRHHLARAPVVNDRRDPEDGREQEAPFDRRTGLTAGRNQFHRPEHL